MISSLGAVGLKVRGEYLHCNMTKTVLDDFIIIYFIIFLLQMQLNDLHSRV